MNQNNNYNIFDINKKLSSYPYYYKRDNILQFNKIESNNKKLVINDKQKLKNKICSLKTEYDNLSLGVAVLYSSNMEAIDRVFDVVIQGVADYRAENNSGATIVNARLGYQMTPELKATLLCKNLFNAEYMFRPGILEPPRHISLRLDAMF